MVNFLFGILIGMVMGYGLYTITDKLDKQIKSKK